MAAITIRDLGDDIKERLRVQAALNGRSMEAEARALLDVGTARSERPKNIAVALIELGQKLGGIELELSDPFPDFQHHRDPFAGSSDEDS
jgi:plasmid stability protein